MSNEALDWRALGAVKRERAAEILGGISEDSVDALIKRGALRGSRAGRRVLVTVHSLRAYLGEVPAGPALSAPAEVPQAPPAPTRPRPLLSPAAQRIRNEARRRMGLG